MFDYMKFLYEPQAAELNRMYGIGAQPGDAYSGYGGTLQRTLAGLNQRGLADAGTSGVILAQIEADRNRQLAELFGQAKGLQRQDIDSAYSNLGQLYPAQFETAQIQPNINYSNAMSRFNQDYLRNSAQQNYEGSRSGSPWTSLAGMAVGSLFGPAGAAVGSQIGSQFGGGGWAQPQSSGFNFSNLFGGGRQQVQPSSYSMPNYGGGNYLATKYPNLFGAAGF
jgi:hypothetical protein